MDTFDQTPVTTVSYRGFDVPIFMDDPGQQYYCYWDGEELGFGAFNDNYEKDLHYLIDQKLDMIYAFPISDSEENFFGARIEWFNNGGFRDIRLLYRNRILKIFLVGKDFILDDKNTKYLVDTSLEILHTVINLKK